MAGFFTWKQLPRINFGGQKGAQLSAQRLPGLMREVGPSLAHLNLNQELSALESVSSPVARNCLGQKGQKGAGGCPAL